MNNPILTEKLAKSLNKVKGEWFFFYLKSAQALPRNPFKIALATFGETLVMISPKTPKMGAFNTAWGFSSRDLKYLDNICAFFRNHHTSPRFNITPMDINDEIGQALYARGLFHTDTAPVLYGIPKPMRLKGKKKFLVKNIKNYEVELFRETFSKGFDGLFPLMNQIDLKQKNWHLMLAYKNNQPAGAAILYVSKKIGNLAAACTLAEFRNQGCQKALIEYRMNLAKKLGCKYVLGSASFGSISQFNQEELGFQIAYTSAIWKSAK